MLPSPRQQHRRIGLAQEKKTSDLDRSVRDAGRPERPAPRRIRGDEGPRDGADGGAEQRRQGVHRHGAPALLGDEQVAQHAAADGEGRGAAEPREEAARDELVAGAGEAAPEAEGEEAEVREL